MTRSRLLILSFSTIASDARVLKQVRHFAERYDVTTCGYGPAPHPSVEHVQLPDDAGFRHWTRRAIAMRRYKQIYWNLGAVQHSMQLLEPRGPFHAVLANDIDTVGVALALNPANGVHADLHEYSPRQNEEQFMWRLFDAPYVTWMCSQFLPQVDSITTVGEGIAHEYLRKFGVDAGVVTNAAPYAEHSPKPVADRIRLVHSGASLRNRRLEVLIDAVRASSTPLTLDLFLMANDPAYVAELRAQAAGSDRIRFPDAVPYEELIRQLNAYDIGVHVVAPTNFNNEWSLPNKFFDYIQARLGVIIGPSKEMAAIIRQYGMGAVSRDFSVAALREVLDGLTADEVSRWKAQSHRNARELSAESQVHIWDAAVARLLSV